MSVWIPLLVHVEDYQELADLVALRAANRGDESRVATISLISDSGASTPGGASSTASDDVEAHPSWPVAALERLAASDVVTAQRWVRAMDAIASADDKTWFTTSEVAELSGLAVNEWRDAPRKITRHLQAHYPDVPKTGDGSPAWPLLARSFGYEVSWAMPASNKAAWRDLRGMR